VRHLCSQSEEWKSLDLDFQVYVVGVKIFGLGQSHRLREDRVEGSIQWEGLQTGWQAGRRRD
jgi:hypothetical protein